MGCFTRSHKTLAEKLYSPAELLEMRQFAAIQRARIPPPGTTNPSNSGNRLAGMATKAATSISTMLGATSGGWGGAAVGMGAGKALEGVAVLRAASQAKKLFAGEQPVTLGQRASAAGGTAIDRLAIPAAVEMLPGKREVGQYP